MPRVLPVLLLAALPQVALADCVYTGAKRAYLECIYGSAVDALAGVAAVAADLMGLQSRVDDAESGLDGLQADLQLLDTRAGQAEARLDLLESDVDGLLLDYLGVGDIGTSEGTVAAGDDPRFGQWSGTASGLDAGTGRASLGLGSAAVADVGDFATAAQGAAADAALPATGGTLDGDLLVTGTVTAEGGVACADGYAHISGSVGTCIGVDPVGEAGCFNDECETQGMRSCSCMEIAQAWLNGRINPTTAADVGGAGEYCMSGIGHCQGHGLDCNTGTAPEIGKIWPHLPLQNASWPNPGYAGYVGTVATSVCDQEHPSTHVGEPYGSYRCCY